jgi:hypothetical protein
MGMDDSLTQRRGMSPSDIVQELEQRAAAAPRPRQPEAPRPAIVESSPHSDEPEEFDPENTNYKQRTATELGFRRFRA